MNWKTTLKENEDPGGWHRNVCLFITVGPPFGAELPNGQRRKGHTVSLSCKVYVKLLKDRKEQAATKVPRKFLPWGSVEISSRMIEMMVWLVSLWASALASHWIPALNLMNCMLKPFMSLQGLERLRTEHVCTTHPTQHIIQIFFETSVLRCLPQVYKIP